jgi:uncharacterized protein (DUF342 family)
MADDTGTSTSTDTAEPATANERLDRLEPVVSRLETVVNKLTDLLPGSHAEAQRRTEEKLDRPSTIEEAMNAELDRRDKVKADAAMNEENAKLRDENAKLRETAPKPPVPRRTRLLGWGTE